MSLRRKSVLCGILILAGFLTVILLSAGKILQESFEQLETREIRIHLKHIEDALTGEAATTGNFAMDRAFPDDIAPLTGDELAAYLETNLKNVALTNSGFSSIIIANQTGEILFSNAIDLESGESIELPAQLLDHLGPDSPLLNNDATGVDGFIGLPSGILQVSSRPLPGDPVAGIFIWGRYVDERLVGQLSDRLELDIDIQRLDTPPVTEAIATAQEPLRQLNDAVHILDNQTIVGYIDFNDIYGRPLFALRLTMPREIHQLAASSINTVLIVILVSGSIATLAGLVFLDRNIFRRLSAVNDVVARASASPDVSLRAPAKGSDELAQLARGANTLLDRLQQEREQTRNEIERRTATLTELQAHLEFLLSTVPAVIFSFDLTRNWKPTFISQNIREITGRDAGYFLESPARWKQQIYPEDLEPVTAQIMAGMEKGGCDFEFRITHENGEYRWVRGAIRFAPDDHGQPVKSVGYVIDVSALKNREQELCEALKYQQELNRLKSQFVSLISHEFRLPLAIIQTSVDTVNLFGDRITPDQRKKQFAQIKRQVQMLSSLVDDILLAGRTGHMPVGATRATCNLKQLLEDLIAEARATAKDHDITLTIIGDPIPVWIDRKLISRAVRNLLANAIKFSPPMSHIAVSVHYMAKGIEISVSDEGIGIAPEDQKFLFEAFHRGKNVGDIPGVGLGLAIVKQAVDAHNGTISVKSEPNAGSVFTLHIPLAEAVEQAPQQL